MYSGQSPRKRKHSEFHDPDYPKDQPSPSCDNEQPASPKTSIAKRQKIHESLDVNNDGQHSEYMQKVQIVVEREFNSELAFKQKQLVEIDERLSKARHLLDKLRYALVSTYYKKQDLPLAAVTTSAVRGAQPLFSREDKGPQMQIHPSLKKLIGKKPKDLSEVIRSCPKRTAAQNAVQTIRAKSEVQKREERKLKQIIRGQGIVIDHSVDSDKCTDITALLNAAQGRNSKNISQTPVKIGKTSVNHSQGKPLNSARLNNKVKHLIVVGNTSKYIGSDQERDPRNKSQILTHKWLVYVQAKDSSIPIERYVKKVRFQLHHSYRPNDVVDIKSPPFHVARRGWGEFPIRVQLYFHQEYNQKPVQLLHTVVLDKTLSGIQTLGAETLLEVWLREVSHNEDITKSDVATYKEEEKAAECTKQRRIPSTEELVDDNLLEFLNKIEASQNSISADIEKIQPTFVISETLAEKSPKKADTPSKFLLRSPLKTASENLRKAIPSTTISTVPEVVKKENKWEPLVSKPPIACKNVTQKSSEMKLVDTSKSIPVAPKILPIKAVPATTIPNHSPILGKTSVTFNKDGKIIMPLTSVASIVRRTILPVTNAITSTTNTYSTSVTSSLCSSIPAKAIPNSNNAPKQILQKKLVQLVDSTGKVKYMQMLVAATSTAPPTKIHESPSSMAPKLVTVGSSGVRTPSVTYTSQTSKMIRMASAQNSTTGGLTMKPNIFKIVPENMQTKPQIVTFSTVTMASTTTTMTSTLSTPIFHKTTTITTKQNTLPSKSLPKSNGSTAKNVVFHKEGKVYIIDPLQIKLKQQQRKQVSLLKPQVSLLKQQMQQKQQQQQENTVASKTATKSLDHDYLPTSSTGMQNNAPQVHFGLKQQRLNSINILQFMQMKRIIFEKQILRQQFTNMQSAVEFILRRLKLIAPKDSMVSAFPFVSQTNKEFQSLTAFKQRTNEWLRAKHISRLMRNHKDLQNVNSTTRETFWSTKEIANFARQFGYTPDIKSLPKFMEKLEVNGSDFKELVKVELKHKDNASCDTITDCRSILKWINKVWPILVDYQNYEDQNLTIDVDNIEEDCQEDRSKGKSHTSHLRSLTNSSSKDIHLPPPTYLENECSLVSDICKDLGAKLVPEEISENVWHPSAETVLAHCLNIFLQKVIRSALSWKHQDKGAAKESVYNIQPSDIAKVLSQSVEFDFLTNSKFGTNSNADTSLMPSLKKETRCD